MPSSQAPSQSLTDAAHLVVGDREFEREEKVLAAVETINHGRVWIDPSLSGQEQARLAAVITALLLYEPLEQD